MIKAVFVGMSALLALASAQPAFAAGCANAAVTIGQSKIHADLEGTGTLTVVFESGNGEGADAWAGVVARARAMGVRTLVYDRAGLGSSSPRRGRYSIDRDVDDLRALLTACRVRGPIVIAAHSYGGFIALRTAARDRRVRGLVLVDANVPGFFDRAETDAILAEYRPQYDAVRRQAPALAATLIPVIEAYPTSATTLRATRLPRGLPIIDIVAEKSWLSTDEALARWRAAHAQFVAEDRARSSVFAAGSGHHVMRDKPELVIDAIDHMVRKVIALRSGR